jgi:hypothetical protein
MNPNHIESVQQITWEKFERAKLEKNEKVLSK